MVSIMYLKKLSASLCAVRDALFFAHNLSPGDEEFIYVLLYNTNTSKNLDYPC